MRASMPAATPAEIAERLSDVRRPPLTKAIVDAAREDVIDLLLEGKPVDDVAFSVILDSALDENPVIVATECACHLLAAVDLGLSEYQKVENHRSLQKWMRSLIERYVDAKPELVARRAAYLAGRD
jgi:hypothetical protein